MTSSFDREKEEKATSRGSVHASRSAVLRVTELNSLNCSYFGNNSRRSANISVVLIHSYRFIYTVCAVYLVAKISIDLFQTQLRGTICTIYFPLAVYSNFLSLFKVIYLFYRVYVCVYVRFICILHWRSWKRCDISKFIKELKFLSHTEKRFKKTFFVLNN